MENNIRNSEFNGLDWTEGSRLHSAAKRYGKTLSDEPIKAKDNSKKVKIICSKCFKEFNTSYGKLPAHKYTENKWKIDEKGNNIPYKEVVDCIGESVQLGHTKLFEHTIKGVTIKPGDHVLYEKYEYIDDDSLPWYMKKKLVTYDKVISKIVQNITVNLKKETFIYFTDKTQEQYIVNIVVI